MNPIEAILLGIIQGLTEFLPVSSSGHIELGKYLFDINLKDDLLFSLILHLATVLSTVFVFRKDILHLIKEIFQFNWNNSTRFVSYILISMLPVLLVGLFFKEQVEAFFSGNIILVGSMLLVTGALLLLSEKINATTKPLAYRSAFIIGIAQAIAVMPGISRSGATSYTNQDLINIALGFTAAFFTGLVACKWMIQLVKNSKLLYFAIYCFLVGTISIFVGLF